MHGHGELRELHQTVTRQIIEERTGEMEEIRARRGFGLYARAQGGGSHALNDVCHEGMPGSNSRQEG